MNYEKIRTRVPAQVMDELPSLIQKCNINSSTRLAHFLAQCHHESGGFTTLRENLNYSASRLAVVFKKYFATEDIAKPYERQPEKIANRVYANRMGNGNEASGDGYAFRGRGYIQLTGRDNYTLFGKFIGEDIASNPDLIATKYPLSSAGWFFNKNNIWTICDRGIGDDVVMAVTKKVNGGTHGLEDRISKFRLYKSLIL